MLRYLSWLDVKVVVVIIKKKCEEISTRADKRGGISDNRREST